MNGDGAINDADRVIDGKRTPSLTGGMTNNLVYKNFDLSIGSAFQTGARLRNQFLVSYCLENNNMNLNNLNRNYWTPENPTNVTLGYTLPKSWLAGIFLSNVRLYAMLQNPLLLTADFVYYPEQLTQNVAGTDFMTTNMIFGVNVSF